MSEEVISYDEVQANILLPYTQANCARMMFFRFDGARERLAETRAWVASIAPKITYHSDVRTRNGSPCDAGNGPWVNIGFTSAGLEALGYDPFSMKYLPEEFLLGMRERADHLGDVLEHDEYADRVHAVVMIYGRDGRVAARSLAVGTAVHNWDGPLPDAVKDLEYAVYEAMNGPVAKLLEPGAAALRSGAVRHLTELDQDAYSLRAAEVTDLEYFGFKDGISQPRITGATDDPRGPDSPAGTVLLGFAPPKIENAAPTAPREATRAEHASRHLKHSSLLVLRKLRQDVDAFRAQAERLAAPIAGLTGRGLAELMMGRHMDGRPMVAKPPENGEDFDFREDPAGRGCPFQAHVRRTNPRDAESQIRRIMRRGLPYSRLRHKEDDKGLMFLAYNANLEAQFEFVQRLWVNSGVENHGLSRDRDPIAGEPAAPESGEVGKATFSFTNPSDESPQTLTGLHSYVQTDWGDYFLVPSRDNLTELGIPPSPLNELQARLRKEKSLVLRRDVIGRWLDDRKVGPRIWEQVRAEGGVVRLDEEGVVLVGSEEVVAEVLRDAGDKYSVADQGEAMRQTTGAFYLGMDAKSDAYKAESPTSRSLIPGWQEAVDIYATAEYATDSPALTAEQQQKLEQEQKAALDPIRLATSELCLRFLGMQLTEAIGGHDRPGRPPRGELDVAKYTAFVLSGLTPRLFGVPQPSAAGTFAMNIPASGYIFFAFPEEMFLEYADQAAKDISAYYSQLFEQRTKRNHHSEFPASATALDEDDNAEGPIEQSDEAWREKLDETLSKLEELYKESKQEGGRQWTKDDSIRTMAGVISGMLIASFKLFVDGIGEYVKRVDVGAPIPVQRPMNRIPFTSMKDAQMSMPNILYRVAVGRQALAGVEVMDGDFVLTCQGSAMADGDGEWFYGDRTPAQGEVPQAPHFCPGYLVADAILETMSSLLFALLPDLRALDDTGRLLDYSFEGAMQKLLATEALAEKMKKDSQTGTASG